jgi:hypothetical protein
MSSVVTLQLGQCGNQLGHALFDSLGQCSSAPFDAELSVALPTFFRESMSGKPSVARAVLVDMEPKVIQQTLQLAALGTTHAPGAAGAGRGRGRGGLPFGGKSPAWAAAAGGGGMSGSQSERRSSSSGSGATVHWTYDTSRQFCQQSGSANNWAYGYGQHGPACHDGVMDVVRKEVECADSLGGFLLMHSLAGGTGSGFGTYVTEALRDTYGRGAHTTNCVVWPFSSGEVIVQSYNAVLTLSHLNALSDAVLTAENDHADAVCRRLHGQARPSFADLNKVIAHHLASALMPAQYELNEGQGSGGGYGGGYGGGGGGGGCGGYFGSSDARSPPRAVCTSTRRPWSNSNAANPGRRNVFAPDPRYAAGPKRSPFEPEQLQTTHNTCGMPPCSEYEADDDGDGLGFDDGLGYSPPAPLEWQPSSSHAARCPLTNLMTHLTPHPGYKMLSIRTIPQVSAKSMAFSSYAWHGLLSHLHQMTLDGRNGFMEEGLVWNLSLEDT